MTSQTLFTTQTPTNPNASDGGTQYELGMKFRSAKPGKITAIRYWKADSETGSHVGKIWMGNGSAILASVAFSNETGAGWQQQNLDTPIDIEPNTTYVVSVNVNSHFPISYQTFASPLINQDLIGVADGNNGVFGNPQSFPSGSYQNSNYFRDVVFEALIQPTITKVSGDDQSGAAGTTLASPLVVQVKDGNGNPQAGTAVSFTVTNGGGSVSNSNAVTDASGQASTLLTLGTNPNTTNIVSVTSPGVGTVTFTARSTPIGTNSIYLENQQSGTTAWKITNQGTTEIAGYATATSVNRGEYLPIKVSLAQPGTYQIDVYRLGYYGGTGGRLMASSGSLNGITQPAPVMTDANTKLVECSWSTSYTVAVGGNWTSGLYVAKLTHHATGKQSQVWFVVRDDSSTSDVLFQSSVTTYIAYNNTGGYSLYGYHSLGGERALKVSLDRPLSMTTTEWHHYNLMTLWERNMVYWMESQGYDISYVTNLDVHSNPNSLLQHKVFLSVGHDEYWSLEQRNALQQARDAGVNLAFFSSNTGYWRVRFENASNGFPNRVMTCYKNTLDPVEPTNKFRSPQNNLAENGLLGIMYTGDRVQLYYTWGDPNGTTNTYGGYNVVVNNANHPYYANTNLQNGDILAQLVGYEWDAIVSNGNTPNSLVILGQSDVSPTTLDEDLPAGTNVNVSHVVAYTAPSGAKVFATGTNQWMWALSSNGVNPAREDVKVKQVTVNVLADMGAKPINPDSDIIVP